MLGAFAGMGMGITVTKHVSEFRNSDPARAGRFIGISMLIGTSTSLIFMTILLTLAPYISNSMFNEPSLEGLLKVGAPLLLLNQLANIQLATLAGLEAFRTQSIVQLLTSLVRVSFITPGAILGGATGAIIALTLATVVQNLALEWAVRRATKSQGVKISYSGIWLERRILVGFSLPTLVASISIGPPRWLCEVLLVRQQDGLGQMAIMNAGNQWRNAVAFLPQQMLSVTLPIMSSLYSKGDIRRYYKTFFGGLAAIAATSLLIVLAIASFSQEIMSIYGETFVGGGATLSLLCLAGVLHMIGRMLVQALQARSRAQIDMATSILRGVTQIALWLALLHYGALGLSISIVISYVILVIFLSLYLFRLWRLDLKATSPLFQQEAIS
jgi:O-antigen/teichoic acid export membrane protein